MNPVTPQHAASSHHHAGGLNLDDILFTLFRHKWLILGFVCLGIAGSVAVRIMRPPAYVSKAKLMVHYVEESRNVNPSSPESQNVHEVDAGAAAIINAQVEILTSLDVAEKVADKLGAERVLAAKGGGSDPMAAAGVIASGITVDPPKGSILTVSFRHPDATIVQPALATLIETFMRKHMEVYMGVGVMDDYYIRQREDYRAKLAKTEEELRSLKTDANILFPDETKRSYAAQIQKVQDELMDATRELAEKQAVLGYSAAKGQSAAGMTNGAENLVPADKLSDYSFAVTELESRKKRERELLLQYTEAYPLVQSTREQIQKLTVRKAELESQFPALSHITVDGGRGGTNAPASDMASDLADIRKLNARVGTLGTILSNIQAQASHVMELEPKITALQRLRDELQKSYDFATSSLERTLKGESLLSGKVVNMSPVQSPTPPGLDYKKMLKLVGLVLAGCIGMGIGLAFLIDRVLDRSIKRSQEIERNLHLPVFLIIPDTGWSGRLRLPWRRRRQRAGNASASKAAGNGHANEERAVAPWDPGHHLQAFTEGLRERVISYFEVHNINQKKPKLVAVTGCGSGAGVSTLASGLAAALSKTGDGNVLLVDMNAGQGQAHAFYKGRSGGVLSDVLEPESRAEAQVQENLYLATLSQGGDDKLMKVLPSRFTHLMPKLKTSDYDYIIFDMPPVTQTSATPRLASYMDLALLVLEAEKTGQHAATRATALMRESRANVAAVLNKYRSHVPAPLAQDL